MSPEQQRLNPSRFTDTLAEALRETGGNVAKAAARLMDRWGGHIIPRLTESHVERSQRHEEIRRVFDETDGDAVETAFRCDISPRSVKRICNGR